MNVSFSFQNVLPADLTLQPLSPPPVSATPSPVDVLSQEVESKVIVAFSVGPCLVSFSCAAYSFNILYA